MTKLEQLFQLLQSHQYHLLTVESATCGLIASTIGGQSGASQIFNGGFVVYTPEAKKNFLKIAKYKINKYGTVSSQIAYEMLTHANKILPTECIISVTGNAGPTALEEKPVGLFYIGFKINNQYAVRELHLDSNLDRNQMRAAVVDYCFDELIALLNNF